jgi:hypothetical protein
MEKSSVIEWHRRVKEGRKMCKITQEVGRCKCGQSTNLNQLRAKIRRETNRRRIEYGNLSGGKDPNSGLASGFSTMTCPCL